MADYIQFISSDGGSILVEVEEEEVSAQMGVQKAGLREITGKAVATAQVTFQDALERMLEYNAQAFIQSVRRLPILPNEAELTFGLNATGEVGNLAIAKAGVEANYTVRLTWKREDKGKVQDES